MDLGKVTGPYLACVVTQERGPGLLGRERPPHISHVSLNGCPGRETHPLRDQLVSPDNAKGSFTQVGSSSDGWMPRKDGLRAE